MKSPVLAAIPLVAFLGHQFAQKGLGYDWPLLSGYLDPFCFIPVLFTALLYQNSRLFDLYRMSGAMTLIGGTFLIILVEEVFPKFGPGFTHDWLDYPVYFLGLAYFWFFINPSAIDETTTTSSG